MKNRSGKSSGNGKQNIPDTLVPAERGQQRLGRILDRAVGRCRGRRPDNSEKIRNRRGHRRLGGGRDVEAGRDRHGRCASTLAGKVTARELTVARLTPPIGQPADLTFAGQHQNLVANEQNAQKINKMKTKKHCKVQIKNKSIFSNLRHKLRKMK